MIEARFDDLRAEPARSFRFASPVGVVEARRPDEVESTLRAVVASAARGFWAAGFVAYDAAPGLDPTLRVHGAGAGVHPRGVDVGRGRGELPLAWFALFERRDPAAPLIAVEDESPTVGPGAWTPSVGRDRYDAAIRAIRRHIAAGDAYQINYTIRLRATIEGDERGLYRDLCLAQRGSYGAYLNTGRYRILSASPELFFRIDGERITTRPMKGTMPRGRWSAEDDDVRRRLVASPKDRAENAMIVDLLRNDLGRISRPGSVEVSRMFEPERYETVWQLTSTVASRLAPGVGLVEVFRSLFPSGSVTGAPKIRSMELISGLEDAPRGVYTGAVGYVAPPGAEGPRAIFNVAIRTVVLDRDRAVAEYGAGGGITHDSSADAEYEEVLAKARVLTARRPRFSLFETLRHEPGEGFRHLREHLDRLASSARYFGFAYDGVVVREAIEKAGAAELEPARVRCVLDRDGSVSAATAAVRRVDPDAVVRLAIDEPSVDPGDPFVYHKTTLRRRYEMAARRHPAADDVVLVNRGGEITESTVANVAVRLGGRWWTPPVDAGLLPGTARALALADGRLAERSIGVDEARTAEAVALISSVRGWRPAIIEN